MESLRSNPLLLSEGLFLESAILSEGLRGIEKRDCFNPFTSAAFLLAWKKIKVFGSPPNAKLVPN